MLWVHVGAGQVREIPASGERQEDQILPTSRTIIKLQKENHENKKALIKKQKKDPRRTVSVNNQSTNQLLNTSAANSINKSKTSNS